ncbi:MAG: YgeY family selenium metabolism-linked hydrolase [Candidatus Hodarchaeales archaeon]|jgi:putative selenium metabolism hydrolase
MEQKIKTLARELEQDVVKFTREMISIPSFPGQEARVIKRIKQEMEKIGYDNIWIDGMGNLMGYLGSGDQLLAFDGHADTVEVGNGENWKYDPFEGKLENRIIYGRGACDQKGGIASMIYAGKILQDIGVPEHMTFLVVVSVQEEILEGLNWRYIIGEDKIVPDAVVLTEPSRLNISNGQRGRVDIKIKTTGISSHGAAPDKGENAIYKMVPIVLDIKDLNEKLKESPLDSVFGKGCISVTNIQSTSPSPNAIADSATIHVDRRLTSQDTEGSVIKEIESLSSVKKVHPRIYIPEHEYRSKSGTVYPFKAFYNWWYTEESHKLTQTAIKAYQTQFSKDPELIQWQFSTNGVGIQPFNIPTIGFGPGNEDLAHTTDDQVSVADLVKAMQFYASLVKNWNK